MAALVDAAALRGVLAEEDFFAAGFLVAGVLRFFGAPPEVVSAMLFVLALGQSRIGDFAFHGATQLAHQCSGA
ncbi:hypothetical protein [Qipengyuania mesophila]|uniref:hypothetical protein n=1 Tax=Qipengyuania mesophila TaxID=2867246 RepID=UPI003518BDE6